MHGYPRAPRPSTLLPTLEEPVSEPRLVHACAPNNAFQLILANLMPQSRRRICVAPRRDLVVVIAWVQE